MADEKATDTPAPAKIRIREIRLASEGLGGASHLQERVFEADAGTPLAIDQTQVDVAVPLCDWRPAANQPVGAPRF